MIAAAIGVGMITGGAVATVDARAAAGASDVADTTCGGGGIEVTPPTRLINLVLDDSKSMFIEDEPHDRWSQAKYALEVFAAMLGEGDALNVYLLSNSGTEPTLRLSGTTTATDRVSEVHEMQLKGIPSTPYNPVLHASEALEESTAAEEKWLVVLSDGGFEGVEADTVREDALSLIDRNSNGDSSLQVAFLAIGDAAPDIEAAPEDGLFVEAAPESTDLVEKLTGFSNRIFQRDELPQTSDGKTAPDIDLRDALVFAQGENVRIGGTSGSSSTTPVEAVKVASTTNDRVVDDQVQADLEGVVARYVDLEKGNLDFDITGARDVKIYYTPKVEFGVQLVNDRGESVAKDRIVSGAYTLKFGFLNDECEIIETSALLGDVDYTAEAYVDGELVGDYRSGDKIDLVPGDLILNVSASYLDTMTSNETLKRTVLPPAVPTAFDVPSASFDASRLASPTTEADAIPAAYRLADGGSLTPELWESATPDWFTVESDANVEWTVDPGPNPGEVFVTPSAPGGDVYAASTGDIEFTIVASHVYDEQLYEGGTVASTTIVDDIPWFDRALHWFADLGWKLLLALLLLILLLGYLFKPRFSKKIKARPTIDGVPLRVGARAESGVGRFEKKGMRTYLPFVADRANLTYWPAGATGFRSLQLKAGRGDTMQLLNWKQVADRKNVAINGTELNEETKRPPLLRPTSGITATIRNQVRFEMTPNS